MFPAAGGLGAINQQKIAELEAAHKGLEAYVGRLEARVAHLEQTLSGFAKALEALGKEKTQQVSDLAKKHRQLARLVQENRQGLAQLRMAGSGSTSRPLRSPTGQRHSPGLR